MQIVVLCAGKATRLYPLDKKNSEINDKDIWKAFFGAPNRIVQEK